jgi:nucleoside-diphosphate-sugar epimerase
MTLVLITGTPGWIGTRLVNVLLDHKNNLPGLSNFTDEFQVRVLVQPGMVESKLRKYQRLEVVRGDLRNPADLAPFFNQSKDGYLIHCAGVVHPKWNVKDFYTANVEGTRNLLQAAEKAGVKRVVALSSNSPFGNNPSREHRFDETSPYNPYMNYGRSKMLMEKVVKEYQDRGEIETVILRPVWFYGPDQPVRQTTFFRMIKNGGAPILGDGNNLRSMVYIDN